MYFKNTVWEQNTGTTYGGSDVGVMFSKVVVCLTATLCSLPKLNVTLHS